MDETTGGSGAPREESPQSTPDGTAGGSRPQQEVDEPGTVAGAMETAPDTHGSNGAGESPEASGSRSKVVALAAGTGAAVAGMAGGIALAARDNRRRVLGLPLGKRSNVQRGASAVVDAAGTVAGRVQEPAKKIGSRFSRE